jgi:DNA-binding GntR family transcriptional regulator
MYTDGYASAGATRADQAYAELKRRLLTGEFPLNVRLGEEKLAALTGMSRTPVREALFRLHAEGLVARWPDGGFRPIAPDVDVMRDIYEVRSTLEIAALRRPIDSGKPHDRSLLVELQEEWLQLQSESDGEPDPGFVALDEAFHVTLAESAGNPVLVDQLRVLNERIRVVRMQDFLVAGRIDKTIEEHLAIVNALLIENPALAEELFAAHIGLSISVVESGVQRAISRMVLGAEEP